MLLMDHRSARYLMLLAPAHCWRCDQSPHPLRPCTLQAGAARGFCGSRDRRRQDCRRPRPVSPSKCHGPRRPRLPPPAAARLAPRPASPPPAPHLPPRSFKYITQLRYSGPEEKENLSCAATLVAPRVLLTLALCAFRINGDVAFPASALFPNVRPPVMILPLRPRGLIEAGAQAASLADAASCQPAQLTPAHCPPPLPQPLPQPLPALRTQAFRPH